MHRSVADRGRLLELMPVGLCASGRPRRMHTNSAFAPTPVTPKTLVTDLELVDPGTGRLDLAGELHAEDPPLRPAQAGEVADEEGLRRCANRSPSG